MNSPEACALSSSRGDAEIAPTLASIDHRPRYLSGMQIDAATAARAFGDAYFNLLRRGADGSLRLSSDHWRLAEATSDVFRFAAREADAPPLEVNLADVEQVVWDRLPKQQVRSQIRFVLTNGDLWTFSGTVDESALPPSEESSPLP